MPCPGEASGTLRSWPPLQAPREGPRRTSPWPLRASRGQCRPSDPRPGSGLQPPPRFAAATACASPLGGPTHASQPPRRSGLCVGPCPAASRLAACPPPRPARCRRPLPATSLTCDRLCFAGSFLIRTCLGTICARGFLRPPPAPPPAPRFHFGFPGPFPTRSPPLLSLHLLRLYFLGRPFIYLFIYFASFSYPLAESLLPPLLIWLLW